MNTINRYIKQIASSLLLVGVAFTSCTEDPNKWAQDAQSNRMFRPTEFAYRNATASSVEIGWKSIPGTKEYVLEVSTDANFTAQTVDTISVDGKETSVVVKGLMGDTDYYARISAHSVDGTKNNSKYSLLTFKTKGAQIMLATQEGDIADQSIVLRWETSSGIVCDRIRVTNLKTSDVRDVTITAAEFAAGVYTLDGLEEGTPYLAELFVRTFRQGYKNFVTKSGVPPADQTITFDPETMQFNQELFNTFAAGKVTLILPANSVVEFVPPADDLKATSINIPANVELSIVGDPNGKRTLLKAPTFGFLGGSPTSLMMQNLDITASGDNKYLVNISTAVTVEKIEMEDCYVYDLVNCPFRLQSSNAPVVKMLKLNNCIFNNANGSYDFITTSSGGSVWLNIHVSNSTFYNWGGARSFIAMNAASPDMESLVIENCTFNNFIGGSKYFVDLSASHKAAIFRVENCILGQAATKTKGIRTATGGEPTVMNCYATTDFEANGGNAIPDLMSYDGTSTDLFFDPLNGIFTFKDDVFAGKKSCGDPRWYSE